MQNRIEPPILLSRLLIFVFAAAVVALFVMFATLAQMFPLNRPQIFFLDTQISTNQTIILKSLPTDHINLSDYKHAFVLEYIRARNEIQNNTSAMRKKWGNLDGIVRTWSDDPIYSGFTKTGLWRALMNDYPDFEFVCMVDFISIEPRDSNTYGVTFKYSCTGNNGQKLEKNYKIRIGIQMDNNVNIRWRDRLDNPLGIKVVEYSVENGGGDPLDTIYK